MYGSARRAYEAGSRTSADSRHLEAAVLFKSARQLEACRDAWDAPDRQTRMIEALRYNQRLWTLFQSELGNTDHPMPPELRADLLRLSAFVDRRTFELLAHPEASGLTTLIEIDRNVAAGLSDSRT